jgi:hypothetical protein
MPVPSGLTHSSIVLVSTQVLAIISEVSPSFARSFDPSKSNAYPALPGGIGVNVAVAVGGMGVIVGVAVGGAGVMVAVAVGGSDVKVGVAVGSIGVEVGVTVGGSAVKVGVAVGVGPSGGWSPSLSVALV